MGQTIIVRAKMWRDWPSHDFEYRKLIELITDLSPTTIRGAQPLFIDVIQGRNDYKKFVLRGARFSPTRRLAVIRCQIERALATRS